MIFHKKSVGRRPVRTVRLFISRLSCALGALVGCMAHRPARHVLSIIHWQPCDVIDSLEFAERRHERFIGIHRPTYPIYLYRCLHAPKRRLVAERCSPVPSYTTAAAAATATAAATDLYRPKYNVIGRFSTCLRAGLACNEVKVADF